MQRDADCAPVALVGGCHSYRYVALNLEQTLTFMNASCTACLVDNALNTCEGDGRGRAKPPCK